MVNIEDNDLCFFCNNEGRTKEDPYQCVHCGRKYDRGNLNTTIESKIYVPDKYKLTQWSSEEFIKQTDEHEIKRNISQNDLGSIETIQKYVENWCKALIYICQTDPLDNDLGKTFFVSAPAGSGVRRAMYYKLANLQKAGYDINDIFNSVDLDLENYDQLELIQKLPSIIINLVNYKLKEGLEKLNYIIPLREQYDRETIIFSTMPYNYIISKIDYISFAEPQKIEKYWR